MDNEPLSQQADSSPNKSGEQPRGQFSKLLPLQREQPRGQFSKLLPLQREQPRGQFSKLLPLQRGGGSESQRGKSKVLT